MKIRRLVAVLGIATAACAALPAVAQVTVDQAWVRGTVPGQKTTGAFMQLKSAVDAAVVEAASPVANFVEIHQMKMEGGMMKMNAVDSVPLPAGKPVDLGPGGYHVMLIDLKRQLKEGDTVPLTLTIVDKSGKKHSVEVKAPVTALTASGPAGGKR